MTDPTKVLYARYSEARKHRASRKRAPESLVGCWTNAKVGKTELTAAGEQFLVIGPGPFTVSADGSQLTWDYLTWQRYSGSGATLMGVWRCIIDGFTEEVSFNADYTYQNRWIEDNETYPGTYAVSGNQVTVRELRATYTATDTTITFYPVYGPAFTAAYTVTQANLHLDFGGGVIRDYTRTAC